MSEQMNTNGTNGSSPLAAITPQVAALQALEADLRSTLLERDEAIRAALVAILARQHVVLLGPPGTGKSMLVTELASRIGGGLYFVPQTHAEALHASCPRGAAGRTGRAAHRPEPLCCPG